MQSAYAVVTARSPRAVVLMPDASGPDGARANDDLDRALEWFGRVWGGAHMLCVPTRDDAVAPVFRRLAAVYDPDVVLPWQPTLGSLWHADPAAARTLAARAESNQSVPAADDDAAIAASTLAVGGRADPEALPGLPTFVRQVASHPPLTAHHLQCDFPAPLTALSRLAQWPGADGTGRPVAPATIADATRETLGRPSIDLDLDGVDPWRRRLLKARLGVIGAAGPNAPASLRLPGESVLGYSIDPSADGFACASVGLTGAFAGQPAPEWTRPSSLAEAPLSRTEAGLQSWSYVRALPRPFLLVAGDAPEDFCLYLCWHRIYGDGSAAWLPAAAVAETTHGGDGWDGEIELVREMLLDLPGRTYAGGWISSLSLRPADLEPLRSALRRHHWHPDVAERFADMPIVAADEIPVGQAPPSFYAAGDVLDRPVPLFIDDDDGTAWPVVRSPVPALMAAPGTAGVALLGNWVADAVVAGCPLPPRRAAAQAAELDASLIESGLVRAGRTGTAFVAVARDDPPSGLLVDHSLTGLSLRNPDLGLLVTGLLPEGTRWELSDTGRFYNGFAEMAGGLEGLVRLLRDKAAYAILYEFMDTKKGPGKAVLTDGRRYLRSFECRAAIRRSGAAATAPADTRQVLDGLLTAGILTRGLVLKCSRCRHSAFHPLAAVADGFDCSRCGFAQPLVSAAWCGVPVHEPSWFYRLDELAYQALDKNVRVPALALDRLGACSPRARHLWSIELWRKEGRWLELDFVCLVDSKLSAGEAKINGALKGKRAVAEVRKTVTGARALQADQVVFATTDSEWSAAVREAARQQTDPMTPPHPLILSGMS